jgi:hypothetical protein
LDAVNPSLWLETSFIGFGKSSGVLQPKPVVEIPGKEYSLRDVILQS